MGKILKNRSPEIWIRAEDEGMKRNGQTLKRRRRCSHETSKIVDIVQRNIEILSRKLYVAGQSRYITAHRKDFGSLVEGNTIGEGNGSYVGEKLWRSRTKRVEGMNEGISLGVIVECDVSIENRFYPESRRQWKADEALISGSPSFDLT